MDLIAEILKCETNEEIDNLITKKIDEMNKNAKQINQLGFNDMINCVYIHSGFIPLKTRIKYKSHSMETYGMETTDFFYEFAYFIKENNLNNKSKIIGYLEYFINKYFGICDGKTNRETIFNDLAWNNTSTDEEYFTALENNKIGDLKGENSAECTERSAVVQQILSMFGFEVYYCIGCVESNGKQEAHCFNIARAKNSYYLLDYSLPVVMYDKNNKFLNYFPFQGMISIEELNNFINNGVIKQFDSYKFIGNEKQIIDEQRKYIIGSTSFEKDKSL